MNITIVPAAFHTWQGDLTVDGEVVYTARGQRPGCVARDILNWMQYNLMQPAQLVKLEITNYE